MREFFCLLACFIVHFDSSIYINNHLRRKLSNKQNRTFFSLRLMLFRQLSHLKMKLVAFKPEPSSETLNQAND